MIYLLLCSPLIAWALTETWDAIQRWADRDIARQYHEAGVIHGTDLRRIDEDVERALREGER